MPKIKTIPRTIIRALLHKQNGRCALSGEKINPANVTLDHIVPLSRKDLAHEKGYGKGWLVSKKVNSMKGSLTLDEFYRIINLILKNKETTSELQKDILNDKLKEMDKKEFDEYIQNYYDDTGFIK